MRKRQPLTIDRILAWADAHRERTGRWPSKYTGRVHGTRDLTWVCIDDCLADGRRGLPGGSSLSRLLAERRGRPPGGPRRSKLTVQQILAWADQHHARHGRWPSAVSGKIPDSGGENWRAIQKALYFGMRGLPGGSSLAKFLVKHRGASAGRNYAPRLSEKQILAWADAHFRRTRQWPRYDSGKVHGRDDENWRAVDRALRYGSRGLAGGETLAALLWRLRGVRTLRSKDPLSIDQILAWADEHFRRTRRWPQATQGEIPGTPGETWRRVNAALRKGRRGLPRGSSLCRLLRERRAVGRLTVEQILAWADRHRRRTGKWPRVSSGAVVGARGERWRGIDLALHRGARGLPGRDSLALLIARHRGVTHYGGRTPLTESTILGWADAHHRRTGGWPCTTSGPVHGAAGETWTNINAALRTGGRGLTGRTTLSKMLHKHRDAPRRGSSRPLLTREQIVAWIKAYHHRTGKWPEPGARSVPGAPAETWTGLNYALRYNRRGLGGNLSLRKLIARCQKE